MNLKSNLLNILLPCAVALFCGGCADNLTPPSDLTIVLPDGTAIYRVDNGRGYQALQLEETGQRTRDAVTVPPGNANDGPVKAYAINRYIDPLNPNIVHERHVVYRNEHNPRWLLDVSEDRQILIGPTVGQSPVNLHPAVINAELATELAKTHEATGLMLNATQDVTLATQDLIAALTASDNRVTALLQNNKTLDERRKAVERQNKALKDENDRLKIPAQYVGDDE
jgi:hypothetical protein